MKGVVFNLLESFIVEKFDYQTWDDIYVHSKLNTQDPFVGPKTYDDEDLFSLVAMASTHLNVLSNDLLKVFGHFSFSKLIEKRVEFLEGIDNPIDFLKSVDGIIHVEIKKLMPDAYLPKITVIDLGNDKLEIIYQSKRKLCAFLEGLVMGCSEYYNYSVTISHISCMHNNAEFCVITSNFRINTE